MRRPLLFWDVRQRRSVAGCRHFGKTHRSYFQGSSNPEERRPQLYGGGSWILADCTDAFFVRPWCSLQMYRAETDDHTAQNETRQFYYIAISDLKETC